MTGLGLIKALEQSGRSGLPGRLGPACPVPANPGGRATIPTGATLVCVGIEGIQSQTPAGSEVQQGLRRKTRPTSGLEDNWRDWGHGWLEKVF